MLAFASLKIDVLSVYRWRAKVCFGRAAHSPEATRSCTKSFADTRSVTMSFPKSGAKSVVNPFWSFVLNERGSKLRRNCSSESGGL